MSEPVAWIYQNSNTEHEYLVWNKSKGGRNWRALYTHPPIERTLTDEVIADLWHQNGGFHHHFARAVERWLKGEK